MLPAPESDLTSRNRILRIFASSIKTGGAGMIFVGLEKASSRLQHGTFLPGTR
jgi:hypothetical protein